MAHLSRVSSTAAFTARWKLSLSLPRAVVPAPSEGSMVPLFLFWSSCLTWPGQPFDGLAALKVSKQPVIRPSGKAMSWRRFSLGVWLFLFFSAGLLSVFLFGFGLFFFFFCC